MKQNITDNGKKIKEKATELTIIPTETDTKEIGIMTSRMESVLIITQTAISIKANG